MKLLLIISSVTCTLLPLFYKVDFLLCCYFNIALQNRRWLKMANIFLLGIYAISAIGFLVQMYYVSEELMTPSFSDIEMKREKLGLKEFHRKYQVQILSPFTQSQIQNGKIRIWTMKEEEFGLNDKK